MAKLALLVVILTGCSIALQSKPNRTTTNECHTTHAYWIADAALTAAAAAAVVYAVKEQHSDAAMTVGGVSVLAGVVTAGSAVSGYRWRSQCASQPEVSEFRPQTAAIQSGW